MTEEMGIGNYVGVGMVTSALVGIMPIVLQDLGLSLEYGIFVSALFLGLLSAIAIYLRDKGVK